MDVPFPPSSLPTPVPSGGPSLLTSGLVESSFGNITTVAGTGVGGYNGDGILATSADLYYPYGISFDGVGDLFIADRSNQRIRKVTISTGIISTVAVGT